MASIMLADDGIEFDGETPKSRPLGGVESAVVELARALADRGHEVTVRNHCKAPAVIDGVTWIPIAEAGTPPPDLYIANRGDKLLRLAPHARRTVFWIHNPARYLLKWRYLSKLWRLRPVIVFIGDYHARTYPAWAPDGGRVVIPYGIADIFRAARERDDAPPPRAVFTSNPLRSLDWLLELWADRIQPRVAGAELHVFSGAATYGAVGAAKAAEMEGVLARAAELAPSGVVVRGPVSKEILAAEFRQARAMLYKGDANETFCAALGESQASGVPAVVQELGSVVERVVDGGTGTITGNDNEFAEAAVRLLTDDDLWRRQHRAALTTQGRWGWPEAASAFEDLIPG